MKPILPREMLWTDKLSMDEFFELDRVNNEFLDLYCILRGEPYSVIGKEALTVFNEVYYQVTRMIYEHPLPNDLPNYISDVKANMGMNYSAEAVMTMSFFLISLIDNHSKLFNKFFLNAIGEKYNTCLFWMAFEKRFEVMKQNKMQINYDFAPCPKEAEWFRDKYIHWKTITRNYDLSCIDHVIRLWENIDDRREIAVMINDSITPATFRGNAADLAQLHHFMTVYLISDDKASIWKDKYAESDNECMELRDRLEEMSKERQALLNRISELEADNERLNVLNRNENADGRDRIYTQGQIVDYCKSRAELRQVESIINMLYKFLRHIGTDSDYDLVDGIEEDFKNRTTGDMHVEHHFDKVDAIKIDSVDQFNAVMGKDATIKR